MPKYLIERTVPGAHTMSADELHTAANTSCNALEQLGTGIQWQQSFITKDKITCVYIARNEDIIREHARVSGFPANEIHEIRNEIGPTTAEPRSATGVTVG